MTKQVQRLKSNVQSELFRAKTTKAAKVEIFSFCFLRDLRATFFILESQRLWALDFGRWTLLWFREQQGQTHRRDGRAISRRKSRPALHRLFSIVQRAEILRSARCSRTHLAQRQTRRERKFLQGPDSIGRRICAFAEKPAASVGGAVQAGKDEFGKISART